jgi:hypothetical protein
MSWNKRNKIPRELCRLQVFGRQPVEKWADSVETFEVLK